MKIIYSDRLRLIGILICIYSVFINKVSPHLALLTIIMLVESMWLSYMNE